MQFHLICWINSVCVEVREREGRIKREQKITCIAACQWLDIIAAVKWKKREKKTHAHCDDWNWNQTTGTISKRKPHAILNSVQCFYWTVRNENKLQIQLNSNTIPKTDFWFRTFINRLFKKWLVTSAMYDRLNWKWFVLSQTVRCCFSFLPFWIVVFLYNHRHHFIFSIKDDELYNRLSISALALPYQYFCWIMFFVRWFFFLFSVWTIEWSI